MLSVPNSVQVAAELVANRRYAEFARRCAGLIVENRATYGLRRDLDLPLAEFEAKTPITVRPASSEDMAHLVPSDLSALSRKDRVEVNTRRGFMDERLGTCFVAIDRDKNVPCYFQWLMTEADNDTIQRLFPKAWFPRLQPGEALLENAYTPPAYRGRGIMSAAMARIALRAADLGCRHVITFVESTNIPSLRGCRKAGFEPYLMREERRLVFGLVRLRRFRDLRADETRPAGIY